MNDTLAGMMEGGKRLQSVFASVAAQAAMARASAQGVARVQAELAHSPAAVSRIDAAGTRAEVATAKASADLRLGILADERRAKLALAAEEASSASDLASRKTAIERESALARRAILEDLQRTADSAAQAALQKYKSYAEEVISTDKAIARNRLDTASAINAILRRDMDPKGVAQSLRDEMAQVQDEANAAARGGDRAGALDLLNRKKGLASELANVKGDGVDPAKMKAEAVAALQDIGNQANALLQEQRAEAVAAAQEQKRVYQELTTSVRQLAEQIAKLNAAEALRLRMEVSADSMRSAIQQIRDSLARETFKINVSAGATANLTPAVSPAGMANAGQAPARAAIAAADQVQQAATPVRAVAPVMVAQDAAKVAAKYRTGPGSYGDGSGAQHTVNLSLEGGRRAQFTGSAEAVAALTRHLEDTASMVGY